MVNQNKEKNQPTDKCIYCGNELTKWERNRSYCWTCGELSSVTYEENEEPELELNN